MFPFKIISFSLKNFCVYFNANLSEIINSLEFRTQLLGYSKEKIKWRTGVTKEKGIFERNYRKGIDFESAQKTSLRGEKPQLF